MARNGHRLGLPASAGRPAAAQDDLVLVHTWLHRCLPPALAEDLAVEVLTRAEGAGPACLAAAPRRTRLQHLSVQAVLRARGVL